MPNLTAATESLENLKIHLKTDKTCLIFGKFDLLPGKLGAPKWKLGVSFTSDLAIDLQSIQGTPTRFEGRRIFLSILFHRSPSFPLRSLSFLLRAPSNTTEDGIFEGTVDFGICLKCSGRTLFDFQVFKQF